MKKNLIFLILFAVNYTLCAQNTFVEYSIKPDTFIDTAKTKNSKFNDIINAESKIKFYLIFSKTKSIYLLQENRNLENDINYKIASILNGGSFKHFRDLETKNKSYEVELAGQFFNVNLNFNQFNWKITTETKTIDGFSCYKAVASYSKIDKGLDTTIELEAVAWFTPEIPSSFGPNGIDGLPGLVLEGSLDGTKFYYATKIILKYDDINKFLDKKPKGKIITEDEFQDFNAKIYNEIRGK